ncbi:hypothetical protein HU830_05055 [Lactobacillus sp. DCY120]|uniref:Major facilitator superfamily permease n=1 Tax=Bombilactobacillus apium TaxID=2675299 RepID=A0A850QXJ3_9LACO|nr:hypothetical protein [Bombilactobacillus apium]
MLCEFPNGVWADLYFKKIIYLLANALLLEMFLLICWGHFFPVLVLAWILYGISSVLWSGTIDAQIINDLKYLGEGAQVDPFVKNDQRIYFRALILGSLLGGNLYFVIGGQIYILAFGVTLIASGLVIWQYHGLQTWLPAESSPKMTRKIHQHLQTSLQELRTQPRLGMIVLLNVVMQIFFQTHYQLWQAFLLESKFPKAIFSLIYLLFQAISILACSVPLTRLPSRRSWALIFAGSCLLALVFWGRQRWLMALIYLAFVFAYSLLDYPCKTYFAQIISPTRISALTSFNSP